MLPFLRVRSLLGLEVAGWGGPWSPLIVPTPRYPAVMAIRRRRGTAPAWPRP